MQTPTVRVVDRQKNAPATGTNGSEAWFITKRNMIMLAVLHDLGKFNSMRDVELVLTHLKFEKTEAGWIKAKTAAKITHLPATNRFLVQEVMPV